MATAVAIAAVVAWPSLWTAVDDAFISARYAANLVAGHGWTYNPGGPPIEGISNPLWTAFVALGIGIGVDAHEWMVVGGLLGWLAAIPGAWLLTVELEEGDGAVVAPWLLACSGLLAVAATNGLETGWYLSALVWTSWAVLRERWDPGAGIALGLLAWLRPEGVLAGIVWIAYRAADRRPVAKLAAGWAAIVVALIGWRLATFGTWLPNTAGAKVAARDWGWIAQRNWIYVKRDHLTWPVVAGVGVLAALWPPIDRRRLALGALATALVLPAFSVELWMPGGRLLAPAYVLAVVLLGSRVARSPRLAAGVVLVGSLASIAVDPYARVQDRAHSVLPDSEVATLARRIRDRAPPGTTAAMRDAGLFAFELGPDVIVFETHERALTRPHPGGADSTPDWPANPDIVVITQARSNAKGARYPTDAALLDGLTVPYEYAGRFHQHRHRYYDVYIRVGLAEP